jgi:hypothetical protein
MSRAAQAMDGGRRKPQFNTGCHETETIEKGSTDGFDAAKGRCRRPAPIAREWFAHVCNQLAAIKKARRCGPFCNAHVARSWSVELKR